MRRSACLFALAFTLGCVSGPAKDDRPLPVDDPEARGIVYGVKASAQDLLRASSGRLQSRYGRPSLDMGETGYGTPYWNLSTAYREFRRDGKPFRSQCAVHCYSYREFPQYVSLSISCNLEKHDLRSTFHGFPDWGWHREQGLYLAHEVMEEIVRAAAIPESDVIRLRRDPTYEDAIKLLEAREGIQANATVEPDVRRGGARGSP